MRVPSFVAGRGKAPQEDFCSERGAHALAARIRAAWARVGVAMETEVYEIQTRKDGESMFGVRMPGMLNGLPVQAPPC